MGARIFRRIAEGFHKAARRVNNLASELKYKKLTPLERKRKEQELSKAKKHASDIDTYEFELRNQKRDNNITS